jgi:hypothetical protein
MGIKLIMEVLRASIQPYRLKTSIHIPERIVTATKSSTFISTL